MPFSLENFRQDYDTEILTMKIDRRELRFFKPKTIDRFFNEEDLMDGFPLWAKIWEASTVLTHHMAQLPVDPQRRILEIGAGLGVNAITSAVMGHAITATECNTDALNFMRANAQLNSCDNITIAHLDWNEPNLMGPFDLIIGSEIAYRKSNIQAMIPLYQRYLSPKGSIIISESVRAAGTFLWEQSSPLYDIKVRKHHLRSENRSHTITLFELHPKQ